MDCIDLREERKVYTAETNKWSPTNDNIVQVIDAFCNMEDKCTVQQ